VVEALRERSVLDPVAAFALDFDPRVAGSVFGNWEFRGGGLDLETRLRVAAVLLGHVAVVLQGRVVEFRLDVPRGRLHRAVDPAGKAVLAPSAAARRAPPRDLDLRRVREGRHLVADVSRREPRRRLRLPHRLLAVGNAVSGGDPREGFRALVAGDLHELRPEGNPRRNRTSPALSSASS